RDHGDIHFAESREEAMAQIVRDFLADNEEHPQGTRVAMALRRADVRALNAAIRSELQNRQKLERGQELSDGVDRGDGEAGRELTFQ
ncbi:hypothetical protein, partial [Agrobacterium tumefaciens]|uniref:hypothetical protein n=1 Tax=Agrobacterium tumefaciens TaxID=358 RepID=UPI003BA03A83